jgi:hypothetical protein
MCSANGSGLVARLPQAVCGLLLLYAGLLLHSGLPVLLLRRRSCLPSPAVSMNGSFSCVLLEDDYWLTGARAAAAAAAAAASLLAFCCRLCP